MVKKRIILILLLISLAFQAIVYATDIEESGNTTTETGSETTENVIGENTEKEPENETEKEEPKQEEPFTNNSSTTVPETTSRPSYESQNNSNSSNKTKSENANLKSLVLEGTDLAPEFKATTLEYTAIVGLDVENIKVTAEAEDSEATVTVKGNKDLEEGENTITIIVEAEAGNTKTYTVKVTKTLNEEAMNTRLKSLIVQGFNIYPSFQNNIYNYNLNINEKISQLEISAETENEKATFVIEGNENLEEGDNLIKIIVTAEDGVTTNEYKINVFINSNVVKAQVESKLPALILLAVLGVTAIILTGMLIKKKRN
ncbi:MAG: cadherin-like beta sandwich domain-containing protein [Clostridia bacterium]